MDETSEKVGAGITITDWGDLQYLDGAAMQFMVTVEEDNGLESVLGYFLYKEDAQLFAEVKLKQLEIK